MRLLTEQRYEKSSAMILMFVDLKKAFHSLNQRKVWNTMKHYGIQDKIIRMVKLMYTDATCKGKQERLHK